MFDEKLLALTTLKALPFVFTTIKSYNNRVNHVTAQPKVKSLALGRVSKDESSLILGPSLLILLCTIYAVVRPPANNDLTFALLH